MTYLKNLFRTRAEWILTGGGILLVAAVGWILIWGVTVQAQYLGSSLGVPKPQYAGEKFDLEKAAALDFRGLKD